MEDPKQATIEAPAQEPKKVEPKPTRKQRRLDKDASNALNELLLDYFTRRSALEDPNGEAAAGLYTHFRNQWLYICTKHNKTNKPIKLNYDAFQKNVEAYLKQERENIATSAAANKIKKEEKDFRYWFRKADINWKNRHWFFRYIFFQFKAKFNKEKYEALWKEYYLMVVVPAEAKVDKCTCDGCNNTSACDYAFDDYNMNGDCLALK
jgi:hypothetical protein